VSDERGAAECVVEAQGVLRRQALFREVNEHIEQLSDGWDFFDGPLAVLCECGDADCADRVDLPRAEYEAVRAVSSRFVLRPGHESVERDLIVERREGYVVVEKRGVDAGTAERLDPRSRRD